MWVHPQHHPPPPAEQTSSPCHSEPTLPPSSPFLCPQLQLWLSPRTVPNQAHWLELPEAMCPHQPQCSWWVEESGAIQCSPEWGPPAEVFMGWDPICMRPLPLLLQSSQVGLECPWNRPPASSRRKGPNRVERLPAACEWNYLLCGPPTHSPAAASPSITGCSGHSRSHHRLGMC